MKTYAVILTEDEIEEIQLALLVAMNEIHKKGDSETADAICAKLKALLDEKEEP